MSEKNIVVGSVVILKSGGPSMTVEFATNGGDWLCTWFDKDGKKQSATFKPQTIMIDEVQI